LDPRHCERLQKLLYEVLPLLFLNNRNPFNIGEVLDVKPDLVTNRFGGPAMEAGQFMEHAEFSMLLDEPLELQRKNLEIWPRQLFADRNHQNLALIFLTDVDRQVAFAPTGKSRY
jgi:hypothetical protein